MKPVYLILSFISMCLLSSNAKGQDLSRHEWKHRVLLVLTSDTLAPDYQKFLDTLHSDPEGLDERKLFIYKATPLGYQEGIADGKWIQSPEFYTRYHKTGTILEVVLIGLDGRVKHRADKLIPLSQIYSWIDVMPMRREELRRKQEEGNTN